MLPLLVTVLFEEVAEAWKGHVVTGEVKGLQGTGGWKKWLRVMKRVQGEAVCSSNFNADCMKIIINGNLRVKYQRDMRWLQYNLHTTKR